MIPLHLGQHNTRGIEERRYTVVWTGNGYQGETELLLLNEGWEAHEWGPEDPWVTTLCSCMNQDSFD